MQNSTTYVDSLKHFEIIKFKPQSIAIRCLWPQSTCWKRFRLRHSVTGLFLAFKQMVLWLNFYWILGVLLNTEGSENFKLDAETSYDPENLYKPGLKVGIDTMLIVGDALLCTWRAEPVDFLMFANFLLWFFVWNLEIEGQLWNLNFWKSCRWREYVHVILSIKKCSCMWILLKFRVTLIIRQDLKNSNSTLRRLITVTSSGYRTILTW